jgi:YggT family protein
VWLLIASAVLSWLIAFNVVNTRNQFVSTVWDFAIYRVTEPALRPIREHACPISAASTSRRSSCCW